MSHLTQWFLHTYGIHVTTASPTNHQSLMAEYGIKSLANMSNEASDRTWR